MQVRPVQERSPAERRRGAAGRWVLLVTVMAVLVTGAAVGLHLAVPPTTSSVPAAPLPSPSPSPAAPGAAPTAAVPPAGAPVVVRAGDGPLLPGIGTGQVYAQSATAVFRVELATGRITRTPTPDLQEHTTFLAGRDWVLVKPRWSPGGVLVRDGQPASPLPHAFDAEGFLHAGPRGDVWGEPETGTDPMTTTTLRLAALDGRRVPGTTLTAPGSAGPYALLPDGDGGVLMTSRRGVHRLEPSRAGHTGQVRLVSRGDLVAAGGRRLLVSGGDRSGRCRLELLDQRDGRRTTLPAAVARTLTARGGISTDRNAYGDAALSPDGARLAVTASEPLRALRTHVVDLRTGRDSVLPGAGPEFNVNRQLAWSGNGRWLLALADHRLRAYDTRTHATRDVALGGEPLLHLTTTHAPAW